MAMTRRNFLRAAAIAGTASLVPLYFSRGAFAGFNYSADDFVSPLAIPAEYSGTVKNGKRVFDLSVQHGMTEFFKGHKTPTMGVNGGFLGPALRMNDGDEIAFNVLNKLNERTILHWHGVHLPARMDGGPRFSIEPGGIWKPEWTVNQQASMQWFHSHQHDRTGAQVYQGIAGLFYIDDEVSRNLDIPKEYGVDDIPLIIQDRNFNRDASFRYVTNMHEGMSGIQGNNILVNGVVRPRHKVARRQMRLRLLNGSNARIYNLRFSDGRKFTQIASDGGFLENAVELTEIRLAPAERAEILVEFANNDDVMLSHKPIKSTSAGGGMGMMSMMSGNDDVPFSVMRFVTDNVGGDVASLPSKIVSLPNWMSSNAAKKRHFELDMKMGPRMMSGRGITINDKSYEMNRIDEVVKLNDIEIWEFTNNSPMPHPMHIHDIQFRIISRNGATPPLNEQGLKDTVLVGPDETVQVITQFTNYADENEPYMFHCHNLEHEDRGMMGQFLVTT